MSPIMVPNISDTRCELALFLRDLWYDVEKGVFVSNFCEKRLGRKSKGVYLERNL